MNDQHTGPFDPGVVQALDDAGFDTGGFLTRKSTHAIEDGNEKSSSMKKKLPVWVVDITLSFLFAFSASDDEAMPPFLDDTFSGAHRSLVPFVMPMVIKGSRVRFVSRTKTIPYGASAEAAADGFYTGTGGQGSRARERAGLDGPELKNDFLIKAMRLEFISDRCPQNNWGWGAAAQRGFDGTDFCADGECDPNSGGPAAGSYVILKCGLDGSSTSYSIGDNGARIAFTVPRFLFEDSNGRSFFADNRTFQAASKDSHFSAHYHAEYVVDKWGNQIKTARARAILRPMRILISLVSMRDMLWWLGKVKAWQSQASIVELAPELVVNRKDTRGHGSILPQDIAQAAFGAPRDISDTSMRESKSMLVRDSKNVLVPPNASEPMRPSASSVAASVANRKNFAASVANYATEEVIFKPYFNATTTRPVPLSETMGESEAKPEDDDAASSTGSIVLPVKPGWQVNKQWLPQHMIRMRKAIAPSCIDLGITLGFKEQKDPHGAGVQFVPSFVSSDPTNMYSASVSDMQAFGISSHNFANHQSNMNVQGSARPGNRQGVAFERGSTSTQLPPEDGAGWGVPSQNSGMPFHAPDQGYTESPAPPPATSKDNFLWTCSIESIEIWLPSLLSIIDGKDISSLWKMPLPGDLNKKKPKTVGDQARMLRAGSSESDPAHASNNIVIGCLLAADMWSSKITGVSVGFDLHEFVCLYGFRERLNPQGGDVSFTGPGSPKHNGARPPPHTRSNIDGFGSQSAPTMHRTNTVSIAMADDLSSSSSSGPDEPEEAWEALRGLGGNVLRRNMVVRDDCLVDLNRLHVQLDIQNMSRSADIALKEFIFRPSFDFLRRVKHLQTNLDRVMSHHQTPTPNRTSSNPNRHRSTPRIRRSGTAPSSSSRSNSPMSDAARISQSLSPGRPMNDQSVPQYPYQGNTYTKTQMKDIPLAEGTPVAAQGKIIPKQLSRSQMTHQAYFDDGGLDDPLDNIELNLMNMFLVEEEQYR